MHKLVIFVIVFGQLIGVPAIACENSKVALLKEIIAEHDDNDPRLDEEFNSLPDSTKSEIGEVYSDLEREERNGRGIVVYILGKNLRNLADLAFFRNAILEPACLSLGRCDQAALNEPTSKITLAYPQLVALTLLKDHALNLATNHDLVTKIWETIASGLESDDPTVIEFTRRCLNQRR